MKSLVLTEKPSVAREIARVLGCTNKQKSYFEGPRHVVTWALGHLVELAEPEDYDKKYSTWRLEDLPIIPRGMRLKVIRQTSHQFRAIQALVKRKDLSELIIATDAGREGELVARWIMELAPWKKPFRRLWISSQTDTAIKEGFASLRPGHAYDNLYDSAVCRAEADWLVGLNVTRALTCKFNAQLSAGRVQTPTLAAIVQREQEIRNFKPVDYWTVEADFGLFRGQWQKEGESRLFQEDGAQAIRAKVQGKKGKITALKTKERREPQPLPYDLTELQRDANRRYGFSAKQTASILQRLYEHHKLVTYPRTDSRHLSSDMVGTLPQRLAAIAVGPYAPLAGPLLNKPLHLGKGVVNDAKVTDHHAIIPTEERLHLERLSPEEARLLDLILRRYIALFYPPCIYDNTNVTVTVEGEEFHARGKAVRQAGWRKVYDRQLEDEAEDDMTDQLLPRLEEGREVVVRECRVKIHQTQPPRRYTEATLLTVMEKHNLGTPATRADIIEKLLQTESIQRQGNALVPTAKAGQLLELVPQVLRSPELTAKWERELEAIARGRGDKEDFLNRIRRQARTMVAEVARSEQEYKHHNATRSRCPNCGRFLLERNTKQGKMLACPDRNCGYKYRDRKNLSNRRCPQCHKKMELRQGKAGRYFQCKPCNVIEMLDGEGEKRGRKGGNRNLLKKYQKEAPLSSSLGDALKAALKDKEE
jgi:DNA topoisomerase-3